MTRKVEGKLALITGGTSGIGLATAMLFVHDGARVVVTGTSDTSVEQARRVLPGVARVVRSDTSSATEVRALIASVRADLGVIDVAFLNAYGLPSVRLLYARSTSEYSPGSPNSLTRASPAAARGNGKALGTLMWNEGDCHRVECGKAQRHACAYHTTTATWQVGEVPCGDGTVADDFQERR
jgi:NAD(P)-dependent dehydrogenase (short-subunit alcohol dehydrogenase family)